MIRAAYGVERQAVLNRSYHALVAGALYSAPWRLVGKRDTFLARLAALVPPPRFNLIRHYGVFANRHKLRPFVTPKTDANPPRQLSLFEQRAGQEYPCIGTLGQVADSRPGRVPWAKLLARVFKVDISTCPKCQGPMRILDAVTDPDKIALLLHGTRAPPRPCPPRQLSLLAG